MPSGTPPCYPGSCILLRKFYDVDADGKLDPDEPVLAGIPFEFWENGDVHKRVTESDGSILLCFPEPLEVIVREMRRPTGGQWVTTTPRQIAYHLECGTTYVSVGNVQIGVPQTGGRGSSKDWRSPAGPHAVY